MIDGIRAALNSKPIRDLTFTILSGGAYGALLFGPPGAFVGATFGLVYQTLRTLAIHLSYDKIKDEISNQSCLNETKKSAFKQGVCAGDSYLEWAKTFIPGKAAYKKPIYYYAGLGAKMYACDDELIGQVSRIRTKPVKAKIL
jgi:hypothetical protein